MNFFSRFKKNTAVQQPLEQSATPEEPQEITTPGFMLHPEPPTGTRFNRKLIITLGSLVGIIMIVAVMSALQPQKKLSPQEIAEKNMIKEENKNVGAPTPDVIATAPDSYSKLSTFEEEQKIKRGEFNPQQPGTPPISTAAEPYKVGNVKNISPAAINSYSEQSGQGLSDLQKEILDARKSPVKFAGLSSASPAQPEKQPQNVPAYPQVNLPTMPWEQKTDDQNMQNEKREFIEKEKKERNGFYVKGGLLPVLSRYELKAGNIIPGVMITGINSDLPGRLVGQVRENIYDTVTGRHLLIPQGTRVIGTYDSKVAYAQERVLIVWTRLIFPNGDSIDLEGMDGVDLSGYAGLRDKVNNHYGKLITGVVLSSILSATAKVAAGNYDSGQASFGQLAASGAAQEVANVGAKIADKNLNVQPTIEITPGMKFNVFVNKDLILRPYKRS